jgi:hypothetical protein
MREPQQQIIEDDGKPEIGNRELLTQINDRDRAHLRAFPLHRKAQVMKQIRSLAPARVVVYQGKNEYEKAVLSLHRDRYRLMYMQPDELQFSAYWYRKDRSFFSKGADVTMLLWEHGRDGREGESTTLATWRIE